jgi:hypothetical protein
MPRNISFAMTAQQIRDRTKTVTRRLGWKNLRQGEILNAVVKCQGLKKGEKIEKLATIRVTDVRRQFLDRLTGDLTYGFAETTREGFPEGHPYHWPSAFIEFFCASHKGCKPHSWITRIEFEYIDQQASMAVKPEQKD